MPSVFDCCVFLEYNDYNSFYHLLSFSFGGKWGDKGYIKMLRNADNHCGIATSGSFPTM